MVRAPGAVLDVALLLVRVFLVQVFLVRSGEGARLREGVGGLVVVVSGYLAVAGALLAVPAAVPPTRLRWASVGLLIVSAGAGGWGWGGVRSWP